ncbi:MAG: pilus assembly protein N-terminal domain-containing protein, partial [Rhodospirillales bacterium]|nr:pilus assembly protein N-terminal domain-containing protein [Rhodospirillales bacterium]
MFKKLLINPGVLASAVMAISVMAYPHAGSAEVLSITLNKTKIVRISRPASVIMIGDPTIADIQVDSSKVLFILG